MSTLRNRKRTNSSHRQSSPCEVFKAATEKFDTQFRLNLEFKEKPRQDSISEH